MGGNLVETKWASIMAVGIAFSIFLGASLMRYADSKVEIEAAKNGLQQCLENNRILWKKECVK